VIALTDEHARDIARRRAYWEAFAWPTPPAGMSEVELTAWLEQEGIAERPPTADETERLLAWALVSTLTDADARDLAGRWVVLRDHLARHDRERLFSWVRARVDEWACAPCSRLAVLLAAVLEPAVSVDEARDLLDAAVDS